MPTFVRPGPLCVTQCPPDELPDSPQSARSRGLNLSPGFRGFDGTPERAIPEQSTGINNSTKPTSTQSRHREANEAALVNKNVKAFLAAIAWAEGGDYDFMFGAVKGKRDDPWRFKDFSTHPGFGYKGKSSASGRYQIVKGTWKEKGRLMGLEDFSPHTQDLMAVELLRSARALEAVIAGDLVAALFRASLTWAALPQGPERGGRDPSQPFKSFEAFKKTFQTEGGVVKK